LPLLGKYPQFLCVIDGRSKNHHALTVLGLSVELCSVNRLGHSVGICWMSFHLRRDIIVSCSPSKLCVNKLSRNGRKWRHHNEMGVLNNRFFTMCWSGSFEIHFLKKESVQGRVLTWYDA